MLSVVRQEARVQWSSSGGRQLTRQGSKGSHNCRVQTLFEIFGTFETFQNFSSVRQEASSVEQGSEGSERFRVWKLFEQEPSHRKTSEAETV